MFNEVTIQKHTGLIGALATDVVPQDACGWVDTAHYDSVRMMTYISQITDAELKIQTAISFEGPWTDLLTYSSAGENSVELECDANATYQLERYVRWRVEATAATWDVCFMISAAFQKVGESKSGLTPAEIRRLAGTTATGGYSTSTTAIPTSERRR